jgi:hypothetical protein
MPVKSAPVAKKATRFDKDYVGKYDGSKDKWMTRKVTDKGGNIKKSMAPVSSKPSEARQFHEGFDRLARDRKVNKKGGK